ncbi:gephyrin-like molybdotransferase Glp [Methanospirillum stamsii]|uniref:Molybdopterin molybdenumtransferase MoeA n=1 Tax=Methanospirillum stamsii TaxID=1277351 RepID=A0A2V2N050_9EURY|nr:gephyrin-like molybdotransferase Glp [Methanospirillum stamsii]PWR73099.1 molybdopterin molybdenumtransferase MoeA [Methanospirillum stamsii]
MSRFLSVISVESARTILNQIAEKTTDETVSLLESGGRILRTDITSEIDIPGFDRSTVDGFAVLASDTIGAGESIPAMLHLTGKVEMGVEPSKVVTSGTCMYIPTGAYLPAGADAVVMIEYAEAMGDDILVTKPVAVGDNIVHRGEDFSVEKSALFSGTRITSREMGVLAACGVTDVLVAQKPRVAIISTGNELIKISEIPGSGQIRDVNTYLCAGFVTECGGIPIIIGTIPDERELLEQALVDALEKSDIILISGGSSKGERDMCADIISSKGELLVHGIALSPGKPTIIGKINNKPVIGLPGHPASAYVVLTALVKDVIFAMTGEKSSPPLMSGILTSPVPSAKGREDYIRVFLENDKVTPVFGKSGLTNTLIKSDGLLRIPADLEGYDKNTRVFVQSWK